MCVPGDDSWESIRFGDSQELAQAMKNFTECLNTLLKIIPRG